MSSPEWQIPTSWCQFTARRMARGSGVERAALLAAIALESMGHDDEAIRTAIVNALPDFAVRDYVRELATRLLKLEGAA